MSHRNDSSLSERFGLMISAPLLVTNIISPYIPDAA